MLKKKIELKDCQEGWILAKPVYNEYGAPVVLENTCMNQYIKSRLEVMNIEHIWVFESEPGMARQADSNNAESSNYEEFDAKYRSNVFAVKEVIHDLAAGKKLDIAKINSISGSLYSEIKNTDYIIRCLGEIREADEYTYSHCINVALYSMLAAKWLRLSTREIKNVVHAGLLHDIGKSKVPADILNKPSRLSPEEFDEIKKHTLYGFEIVKSIDNISEEVCQAVLMHHEREDETGYPTGSKGQQVNIYSRIVAVTDVYDAMTSDRVYKKRATPFEAFHMFSSSGLPSFDAHISKTFITNLSANYVGTKVVLNNGESGEIAYIPPHNITKPIISLKSKFIDTSKDDTVKIECILK